MNHVGWTNQGGERNDTAYGEVEVQGKLNRKYTISRIIKIY